MADFLSLIQISEIIVLIDSRLNILSRRSLSVTCKLARRMIYGLTKTLSINNSGTLPWLSLDGYPRQVRSLTITRCQICPSTIYDYLDVKLSNFVNLRRLSLVEVTLPNDWFSNLHLESLRMHDCPKSNDVAFEFTRLTSLYALDFVRTSHCDVNLDMSHMQLTQLTFRQDGDLQLTYPPDLQRLKFINKGHKIQQHNLAQLTNLIDLSLFSIQLSQETIPSAPKLTHLELINTPFVLPKSRVFTLLEGIFYGEQQYIHEIAGNLNLESLESLTFSSSVGLTEVYTFSSSLTQLCNTSMCHQNQWTLWRYTNLQRLQMYSPTPLMCPPGITELRGTNLILDLPRLRVLELQTSQLEPRLFTLTNLTELSIDYTPNSNNHDLEIIPSQPLCLRRLSLSEPAYHLLTIVDPDCLLDLTLRNKGWLKQETVNTVAKFTNLIKLRIDLYNRIDLSVWSSLVNLEHINPGPYFTRSSLDRLPEFLLSAIRSSTNDV